MILGNGGHARVVADACATSGRSVAGYLGPSIAGEPHLGGDDRIEDDGFRGEHDFDFHAATLTIGEEILIPPVDPVRIGIHLVDRRFAPISSKFSSTGLALDHGFLELSPESFRRNVDREYADPVTRSEDIERLVTAVNVGAALERTQEIIVEKKPLELRWTGLDQIVGVVGRNGDRIVEPQVMGEIGFLAPT